jgi:DNA gyrase subunit A
VTILDRQGVSVSAFVLFVTERGRVKRVAGSVCEDAAVAARRVVKVGAGDRLAAVVKTSGSDEVVVATRHGMAMRFSERDVGASGMSSAPVRGVRLNSHDKVVSAAAIPAGTVVDLLTLTERGHAKRTSIEDFRLQRRGGRGVRAATLNKACGALVTALVVAASDDVLVGSDRRRLSRIPATSVRLQGRASTGSCVAALDPSERVAAAVPVSNR